MIKDAMEIAEKLMPPDDSPAWKWIVSTTLVGLLSVTLVHVAWACGWLPGATGFALASEVDEARAAIEERLAGIEQQQNISLQILMAQEICRLYRLRESSDSLPLTNQLTRSLEEKQQTYAGLSGSRYPLAECAPQG